ncbi:hypothetical protein [Amycolatopsis nalaikhensis]|uniref:Uncharacterized protein n=1 Tax=Amycolatopsis nalaikhensis TaxID=715472 RepID=A0ABY8XU49_9PSEU|nr:hypothetical protein [Amycolatopsis sp. 2-2]WIV59240.1 hypothetical protein QP939_11720 [Amycolatopsis sp. 2-2]
MRDEIVGSHAGCVGVVRWVTMVISFGCGLFAVVLAAHIVLVLAEANPRNGFVSFIGSWAPGVSLGLRDLFTLGSDKIAIPLNDGTAAILWLLIAVRWTERLGAAPAHRSGHVRPRAATSLWPYAGPSGDRSLRSGVFVPPALVAHMRTRICSVVNGVNFRPW